MGSHDLGRAGSKRPSASAVAKRQSTRRRPAVDYSEAWPEMAGPPKPRRSLTVTALLALGITKGPGRRGVRPVLLLATWLYFLSLLILFGAVFNRVRVSQDKARDTSGEAPDESRRDRERKGRMRLEG